MNIVEKECKDCGGYFRKTGRNQIRCSSCKPIHEKKMNRLYDRKKWYKDKYGISLESYTKMLENQQGCCSICKTPQVNLKITLAVDHCHSTGKVRGLLCRNCNLMIGFAKDNKELLSSAIRYLEKYKEK
jgi:hypothetical protein